MKKVLVWAIALLLLASTTLHASGGEGTGNTPGEGSSDSSQQSGQQQSAHPSHDAWWESILCQLFELCPSNPTTESGGEGTGN